MSLPLFPLFVEIVLLQFQRTTTIHANPINTFQEESKLNINQHFALHILFEEFDDRVDYQIMQLMKLLI